MGVHADSETYRQVKALLGIPEDEPIFILRAQDVVSVGILTLYEIAYKVAAAISGVEEQTRLYFADHIAAVAENFRRWQTRNRDAVKIPD